MSLSKYILKILYMYVSFKVGLKKYCTNGCGHSLPFEYVCFGLSMVPKLLCVASCQILINMLSLQFLNQKGKLRAGSSAIEFTQL